MNLLILLAVVAIANGAKLNRNYLPPDTARTSGGSGQILETPNFSSPSARSNGFAPNTPQDAYNNNFDFSDNSNGFAQDGFAQNGFAPQESGFDRPERPQAALERSANILRSDNQNDGDTFSYAFETENGISAEESGVATNGVEAQGGFSYTGDDGQVYSIRYTADQNGFVPQGDHLPTPPPIPEEILKALEKNAQDEAAGIFDDGTYNEAKYGDSPQQYSNNGYNYPTNNNINNVNNNYENNNVGDNYNNYNNNNNDDTVTINSAAIPASNKYLPPFGNQQQAAPGFRNAGQQNYRNPAQRRSGPSNQYLAPRSNGVTKAYLPPRNQPSFRNFGQRNQPNRSNNGYNY